jgi:glycosyltransferase involved in cell wall biosynthesis
VAETRVLYVSASPMIGGGNRSLLYLCGQLGAHGYAPHVVVPGSGPMADELGRLGVPYTIMGTPPGVTPSRLALAGLALRFTALVLRLRPALVHVNGVEAFRVPGCVARALRVPAICHVRYYTGADSAAYFLKCAPDVLVFNSRHMLSSFPEVPWRTGQAPARRVIYNGFDPDAYTAPEARKGIREAWGSGNRIVVGVLGNLAPVKGHEHFLRMARRLLDRGRSMQFVIVGGDILEGGAREAALKARARAEGLEDEVAFAGFARDVAPALAAFDVLVVPSTREPFGRVAVEGLLAGLPVVASDVGGLPEALEGCTYARLVAPEDTEGFVAAIESLAPDTPPTHRSPTADRAHAARRFGHATALRELIELYASLTRASRPSGAGRATGGVDG